MHGLHSSVFNRISLIFFLIIVIGISLASQSMVIAKSGKQDQIRAELDYRTLHSYPAANPTRSRFHFAEDRFGFSMDARRDYPIQIAKNRYFEVRFEVRPGDQAAGDAGKSVERAELAINRSVQVGQPWGLYNEVMVPAGQTPNDPRSFNTLFQVHSGSEMNGSPPFSMTLDYDDVTLAPILRFLVVQSTTPGQLGRMQEVARISVQYGQYYQIFVKGICSAKVNQGALEIVIDGRRIFSSNHVPMGYAKTDAIGDYAKFGIYRGANGGPILTEPLIVYARNFKFGPLREVQEYIQRAPWHRNASPT